MLAILHFGSLLLVLQLLIIGQLLPQPSLILGFDQLIQLPLLQLFPKLEGHFGFRHFRVEESVEELRLFLLFLVRELFKFG